MNKNVKRVAGDLGTFIKSEDGQYLFHLHNSIGEPLTTEDLQILLKTARVLEEIYATAKGNRQ